MKLSLSQLLKWLILTLLFPLIFLNAWLAFRFFAYFQPIVTIFVLATLLAFILNYPVKILQHRGIKRSYAVALVFISALMILVALGIILLPIVLDQLNEMAKILPQWIDSSNQKIQVLDDWAVSHGLKVNFSHIINQIADRLPDELQNSADHLVSIIIETIDSVSDALITVVFTFYLLLDGPRLWEGIFKKLPWSFAQQVSQSIQENFQNYLIGQVTLALLMGFSLTLIFLLFKIQFALIFGLGIGIFSLIPFGDIISIIGITLIIASHNFWLAVKILVVAIIIDQLIDQAIAPRLLGNLTGLRPIWVLIALLVGTYIGGLLGLVIAVPVAGFIKDVADGLDNFSPSGYSENNVKGKEAPEMLTKESTS
jgi:predicted PurR-regulated permease PerM